MLEGSIHITKLGKYPLLYAMSFVPQRAAMTGLTWRECKSLEAVRKLLERIGVDDDEMTAALATVYQGRPVKIRGMCSTRRSWSGSNCDDRIGGST
jgi:hypothetical protein